MPIYLLSKKVQCIIVTFYLRNRKCSCKFDKNDNYLKKSKNHYKEKHCPNFGLKVIKITTKSDLDDFPHH